MTLPGALWAGISLKQTLATPVLVKKAPLRTVAESLFVCGAAFVNTRFGRYFGLLGSRWMWQTNKAVNQARLSPQIITLVQSQPTDCTCKGLLGSSQHSWFVKH